MPEHGASSNSGTTTARVSHTRSQSAATSARAIPTIVRDLRSITLFDPLGGSEGRVSRPGL